MRNKADVYFALLYSFKVYYYGIFISNVKTLPLDQLIYLTLRLNNMDQIRMWLSHIKQGLKV